MCLSIAIDRPHDVLATGEHLGLEWTVTNNGTGHRCGYVRVPIGHPWHGKDDDEIDAEVHGGLTFAEAAVGCDKGGPDDAWWIGFDCGHVEDAPDPTLTQRPLPPHSRAILDMGNMLERFGLAGKHLGDRSGHIWTQDEVEEQCRGLCRQAAEASSSMADQERP
jgi:hypothetical protein